MVYAVLTDNGLSASPDGCLHFLSEYRQIPPGGLLGHSQVKVSLKLLGAVIIVGMDHLASAT